MGKDYTPLISNGLDWQKAWNTIKTKEVIAASKQKYFERELPEPYHIEEIELGYNGTNETIVRYPQNHFIVFDGTIPLTELKKR